MMKDFMDTIKFAALAALTMGFALGARMNRDQIATLLYVIENEYFLSVVVKIAAPSG